MAQAADGVTGSACAGSLRQLRQAAALVVTAVAAAAPDGLAPGEAREMARLLGALQKLAAASAVRYAKSAGRDGAAVLANAEGTSVGKARAGLSLLERLTPLPEVSAAFCGGHLSIDQAAVIAPVARAVPGAARPLLEKASSGPMIELKQEAARILQRARGEAAQAEMERRLHAGRFCRLSFPAGGGVRLEAFFSPLQGARVKAALERATRAHFEASRSKGGQDDPETPEHLRADALAALVCGSGARVAPGVPNVLVRVDATSLRRGEVVDGETCEIAGVGPVSVAAARSLLGEGFLTLLVQDGVDIRTVTTTKRAVPRRVSQALLLRDQRCVVPGCSTSQGLEIDHWGRDFAWSGPTSLDNLCRICHVHHKMKTEQGWRLVGGPGRWRWLPPKSVAELAAGRDGRPRSRAGPAPGSPSGADRGAAP